MTSQDTNDLLERLTVVSERAVSAARSAVTMTELDEVRREFLGRSGSLLEFRRAIGSLPTEARKTLGAAVGAAQGELEAALEERQEHLLDSEPVLSEPFDVTLPGTPPSAGALHPTVQMMYDLNDAFTALNFEVYEGPEISSELFEFDHMNFPADHPARESMDT